MNIALSVLILVLLLLPGATVVKAYTTSLTNPKSNLHVPFNDLLFRGLVWSVIIHTTFVCSLRFLWHGEVQYTVVYELIAGKDLSVKNAEMTDFFRQFSLYIVLTILVSWLLTKFAKTVILHYNFDFTREGFSAQNYWFIIFSGRYIERDDLRTADIDFVFVDILTENGSIYSGILTDYNYNRQRDELENIIITEPRRREMIKDPQNEGGKKIGPPVPIPGEIFVIPSKKIVNINLFYVGEMFGSIVSETAVAESDS